MALQSTTERTVFSISNFSPIHYHKKKKKVKFANSQIIFKIKFPVKGRAKAK